MSERYDDPRAPTPDHLVTMVKDLDRHVTAEIAALRREMQASNSTAEKAVGIAADEANARLAAHNGLIEQMRQQSAHFASQESLDLFKEANDRRLTKVERFQMMVTGALVLIGAIGVTNLVKVWGG